ncbi:hypothetical protein EDC01DRAFT_622837 [Geopyxis carbonaria]|nr:hypothetical protein EDC01DRAFT_622837 [Geopyxis carbonaria]
MSTPALPFPVSLLSFLAPPPSGALTAFLLLLFSALTLAIPLATPAASPGAAEIPRGGAAAYYPKAGFGALCIVPAPWTQIVLFMVSNYVARLATFKKSTGYEGWRDYRRAAWSLLVPFLGINEAADTIARGSSILGRNDVDRALLAQALVVLVRVQSWMPVDGEVVRNCWERQTPTMTTRNTRPRRDPPPDDDGPDLPSATLRVQTRQSNIVLVAKPEAYKVQGHYKLPPGYALAVLPPGAVVGPLRASNATKEQIVISNSYDLIKSFAAMLQIVSSIYAVFTAYAGQTLAYGYSAFGFSVVPYTIMSILNAVANLVEASYDTLYLVRSQVMEEAERRNSGEFTCEVAELPTQWVAEQVRLTEFDAKGAPVWTHDEATDKRWRVTILGPRNRPSDFDDVAGKQLIVTPLGGAYAIDTHTRFQSDQFRRWASTLITLVALVVPYVTIGAMSRFAVGQNNNMRRRVFMMGWLVFGQILGVMNLVEEGMMVKGKKWPWWVEQTALWLVRIGGTAMAVGGLVEVVTMLREFGFCLPLLT